MPQNTTLTHNQAKFIAARVSESTLEAACKACGISDETGRRWLKLAHVKAAYEAACKALFDEALLELQRSSTMAIATLRRNLAETARSQHR